MKNSFLHSLNDIPFTLDQLLVFNHIATLGSFKKAADNLYISQPAVSIQIQRLEKQLNVQLLDRKGKQTYLTDAGYLLLSYSEKIIGLCEETRQSLEELKNFEKGNLIIGTNKQTKTCLISSFLNSLKIKYPNINFQLELKDNIDICSKLTNEQIDIGFIEGNIPQKYKNLLQIICFHDDLLLLIVPCSHPFSNLKRIEKNELYNLNFISLSKTLLLKKIIDNQLTKQKIDITRFKIKMEISSLEELTHALQSELGATFVFKSWLKKEIKMGFLNRVTIRNVNFRKKLFIVTRKTKYQSIVVEKFQEEFIHFWKVHLLDGD